MANVRDVKADYVAAYRAEYEAQKAAGRDDEAEAAAKALRDLGAGVTEKAKKRSAPERADAKRPAEDTAEPKPQHKR